MIDQKRFHECLQDAGVDFITGVPDSLLNEFCLYAAAQLPPHRHVIAANEGNAVALAAGHHLATGGVPLVYMQNSGLGNAMNPLLSLTNREVYAIPLVVLIGWRGDPAIKDHAQHKKQGELTPSLLDSMDIPFKVIENDGDDALDAARWAVGTARRISAPAALLAKKGTFAKGKKNEADARTSEYRMSREDAIRSLLECLPRNTIFVATTGRATRELYELRDMMGAGHELDFLNVGAMGHASQIAAGIALAQRNRLVVCLDGDGAAIMHLGGLTTVGKLAPTNFLHVVLNNGAHESVGGQPTAGFSANLTTIAGGCGYRTIGTAVASDEALRDAITTLVKTGGPAFIDARVRKGIRSDLGPLNASLDKLRDSLAASLRA